MRGTGAERGSLPGSAGGDDECPDRRGNAGQIIRRREVPWSRRKGEKGPEKKLVTIEAGMCMKTDKKMTVLPRKKRHFLQTERHFIQKHTYFAETVGFFVAVGALGNETCDSKRRNSSSWISPTAYEGGKKTSQPPRH